MEPDNNTESQFHLLKTKRFFPFFLTQFLGAFNDNLFKNTLILMITYGLFSASDLHGSENIWTNIASLLFILPFFLFSALAGQLADKFDKSVMIQYVKLMEVCIMLIASLAFYKESFTLLVCVLFLMGTQSALFGPVKYAILPDHLSKDELIGGNALIEMGTFFAILLGFIGANSLTQIENAPFIISVVIVLFAFLGYMSSRQIPTAPSTQSDLKIELNPFIQIKRIMQYARADDAVFHSIIGISWFWFLGAAYLTQLPNFTKDILSSSSDVVTLLLCAFSVGIGLGSLWCERLSGHRIEWGIVPLGSLGLTLFGVDLFFACQLPPAESLRTLSEFMALPVSWRVLLDLVCIGIFGGFYIVPLYALIQVRTEEKVRAQVISANNIMNALFMVLSALVGVLLLGKFDIGLATFFLWLAIVNGVVAIYIFHKVPVFAMRFIIWILTHTIYKVSAEGVKHIPETGAAVLVCNHISYVDGLLIGGISRRPIRFVMYKPIYDLPIVNFVFRVGRTVPIVSQKRDPEAFEKAFQEIRSGLAAGDLFCIFPEGKLTYDGEIDGFRPGIERIIRESPVPVVPMALQGLWGSIFSRKKGALLSRFSRLRTKVKLIIEPPIPAEEVSAIALENRVKAIRGELQ